MSPPTRKRPHSMERVEEQLRARAEAREGATRDRYNFLLSAGVDFEGAKTRSPRLSARLTAARRSRCSVLAVIGVRRGRERPLAMTSLPVGSRGLG